jgi:hypothetical protein
MRSGKGYTRAMPTAKPVQIPRKISAQEKVRPGNVCEMNVSLPE